MMRWLIVISALSFAACSNDFSVPTRDGGGGADGGAGIDANTTIDAGPMTDANTAIDAGPPQGDGGPLDAAPVDAQPADATIVRDGGNVTCNDLRTQYQTQVMKAALCDPAGGATCTATRQANIDCGCPVPLSAVKTSELAEIDRLGAQWTAMNCGVGIICPAVLCTNPLPASCAGSVTTYQCRTN